METAGLVLGAVNTAALFITCIQCFDIVVKGKQFSQSYEQLYTLFAIQRTRFGLWGESVGLIPDPFGRKLGRNMGIDRPDIRPLIESTLNNIWLLLQGVEAVEQKYHSDVDTSVETLQVTSPRGLQIFEPSFHRFKEQITKKQKATSAWKVTQWAIHDEAKLKSLVEKLKDYVDGLESITTSLGLLLDQHKRLRKEIDSISDVESLRLLSEVGSKDDNDATSMISETASRRLRTVAESIKERQGSVATTLSILGEESFVTAPSKASRRPSKSRQFLPGMWPESAKSEMVSFDVSMSLINQAIVQEDQKLNSRPLFTSDTKMDQVSLAEILTCPECQMSLEDCTGHIMRTVPEHVHQHEMTSAIPQNQRLMAHVMKDDWTREVQSFASGDHDYGASLSAIKAEDLTKCNETSAKLVSHANTASSAAKRMFLELRSIRKSGIPFISAVPVGDDLDKILASIEGPPDTPYAGGIFWLTVAMPKYDEGGPPMIRFQTKIYHPNISPQGDICADFGNHWKPSMRRKDNSPNKTSMWYLGKSTLPHWTLGALLVALCGLLASPDVDDPLVPEIAQLYVENYVAFCDNARTYTNLYAIKKRPDEDSLTFMQEIPMLQIGDTLETILQLADSPSASRVNISNVGSDIERSSSLRPSDTISTVSSDVVSLLDSVSTKTRRAKVEAHKLLATSHNEDALSIKANSLKWETRPTINDPNDSLHYPLMMKGKSLTSIEERAPNQQDMSVSIQRHHFVLIYSRSDSELVWNLRFGWTGPICLSVQIDSLEDFSLSFMSDASDLTTKICHSTCGSRPASSQISPERPRASLLKRARRIRSAIASLGDRRRSKHDVLAVPRVSSTLVRDDGSSEGGSPIIANEKIPKSVYLMMANGDMIPLVKSNFGHEFRYGDRQYMWEVKIQHGACDIRLTATEDSKILGTMTAVTYGYPENPDVDLRDCRVWLEDYDKETMEITNTQQIFLITGLTTLFDYVVRKDDIK